MPPPITPCRLRTGLNPTMSGAKGTISGVMNKK